MRKSTLRDGTRVSALTGSSFNHSQHKHINEGVNAMPIDRTSQSTRANYGAVKVLIIYHLNYATVTLTRNNRRVAYQLVTLTQAEKLEAIIDNNGYFALVA